MDQSEWIRKLVEKFRVVDQFKPDATEENVLVCGSKGDGKAIYGPCADCGVEIAWAEANAVITRKICIPCAMILTKGVPPEAITTQSSVEDALVEIMRRKA